MKYFIGALLCAFMFVSCKSSTPAATTPDSTATATTKSDTPLVIGLYKGDFSGSPIYITINYAHGLHLAGYNIHKGLRRNVSGTLKPSGDGFEALLNEPGDNPFDGHFKVTFNKDFSAATATWTPVDPSLKAKNFSLKKATMTYDETAGAPGGYDGDHCDINFGEDGSVELNYYDQINDSTFAQQMVTIRGTWEKSDTAILVNWQKESERLGKRTAFHLVREREDSLYDASQEGDGNYIIGVKGAGFSFSNVGD